MLGQILRALHLCSCSTYTANLHHRIRATGQTNM
uniref:Uncharacterized protein n=1 Tax=Arundo donax TaxID=35708 RepID=A0A0A9ACQ8_ARUDO